MSTSSIEMLSSCANQPISIAVKALRWTPGSAPSAPHHLEIPIEREIRMQAADDVELGDLVAALLCGVLVDLVVAHLPGVIFPRQSRKTAELAVVGIDTDVGRIDVPVDVVVGNISVESSAHVICKPAELQKIGRCEAETGVVGVEANARLGPFLQGREAVLGRAQAGSIRSLAVGPERLPQVSHKARQYIRADQPLRARNRAPRRPETTSRAGHWHEKRPHRGGTDRRSDDPVLIESRRATGDADPVGRPRPGG